MPQHDAARDEKAEAKAAGAALVVGGGHLHQGIEDHLQRIGGNRRTIVLHLHADRVGRAVRLENHRRILRAVLDRVVQKVAEDLLQAFAVEGAVELARDPDAKGTIGMARSHLLDHRLADASDVAGLPHDRNPAPQPGPGVLEEVPDHGVHLRRAALDARHGLHLLLAAEQPRPGKVVSRHRDRGQRAAQIVSQDREEGIARARELFRVARGRLRQRLVDRLVEAREVVERAVVLSCEMRAPQLDDARPQCPVFGTELQQVEAAQVAQRAVRGGRGPFAGSILDLVGLDILGDRLQDRPGVVAQRERSHRRRGGQERARERFPFGDDLVHVLIDEAGERQRLGPARQVQQALELRLTTA